VGLSGESLALIAVVMAIVGPVIGWAVADGKSKGRADAMAEKLAKTEATVDEQAKTLVILDRLLAERKQELIAMAKEVARLNSEKAPRETMESLQAGLESLRHELDRRMDRLENLIRGGRT
jgi:septal ring factor EnvC (AmiA/AmiB activator)